MSRRHADNWSQPGQYLVDPYTWPQSLKWSRSWSWMTYCHTLCAMSIGPPILRYHENPWSRSCVWSKVKVTFDLQISKVKIMVKVKPIGHIWGLEFNRYVCISFRGNRTTFGWDIGNSIFDLENSRSRSWPMSSLMVTFEALEFNRYVCFSFRGNRTIFGWYIANSIFDIENSGSRSWPMSSLMVTFEALEFNRYVCFSFCGNRTIFGWYIANSIFDLEKSRSRSRRKSTEI